ncbi:MAG: hypothetical protein IJE10_08510 [Clostridia bacterium]|nr:hypothetical protein [Clostridia bacterium]
MKLLNKIFRNDKFILVISVLAAIGLWMAVVSEQNPMTDSLFRGIKINRNHTETMMQDELKIISVSAETADVKVNGRLSDISNIILEDVSVSADFSSVTGPGTYTIPLVANVRRSGITVSSIEPSEIKVVADYIGKNRFQVEPVFTGTLPDGYVKDSFVLGTNSITIEGPAEILEKVARVVVKVDLDNVTESISAGYKPVLLDNHGTPIHDHELTMSSTEIWVDVPILMEKDAKVNIRLDSVVNLDSAGIHLSANPDTVKIQGERAILADIEGIETEPLTLPDEPQGTVMLKLVLPEGVRAEPSEVEVKISVAADQAKKQ